MLEIDSVTGSLASGFLLLLQETGEATGEGSDFGFADLLPMFLLLYLVIYFMMIRPQKKEKQRHEQMLGAMKKNDQVQTSAGFFGKVVSVDNEKDQVILKIDEQNNVRIRVLKSSIVSIVTDKKKEPSPARS